MIICSSKNGRDFTQSDTGDTDGTTDSNTQHDDHQMFQLFVCESGVTTDHALPDM